MRAVIFVVVFGGCRITGTFECSEAKQCRGPSGAAGACIAGSCAYADGDCTAGFRFAESAADEVAGACLESVPPVGCVAWTPRHFAPCDLPAPVGSIQIATASTYDTDSGQFDVPVLHTSKNVAQKTGTMVRVISVTSLAVEMGGSLRVSGSLPLVIAAWDSIAIAGRVEVNSQRGGPIGAGANPIDCLAPTPGGAALELGSGGGGAGGFRGTGGGGGSAGSPMTVMGGIGGAAATMSTLAANVRGGCPGAASGAAGPGALAPATPASIGEGGAGGGALQLTARRSIAITGRLLAGGAGGGGAPIASSSGGGGGGSGGYLGLEAPAISVAGTLAANGGGGGGGGADRDGGDGADGNAGMTAARGGSGGGVMGGCSGDGGNGAAAALLDGGNANNNQRTCGGGGGGGGAGVIAVRSAAYVSEASANISPPVVIDPP